MEELIRLAEPRLLTGAPKAAPERGSLPAEVGQDIHGCVGPQRPIDAQKKGQAEVSRETEGGREFPESPDIEQAAPVTGNAKYAAWGILCRYRADGDREA